MTKGNIIVVEACSTGYNYIEDIIKRGYEPIVLETKIVDPETEEFFKDYRKKCYSLFPREVTILPAGETYEEDLERVKKYNPVLILAGEEHGVERTTHLADDLGLPGNPYKNMDRYVNKDAMHKALIDNGVRGIRGKLVKTVEEAEDYLKELGSEKVAVKAPVGCGSQGLKLCESVEEMRDGFNALMGNANYFGDEVHEVLIQERIYGKEYIVNTISRHGKHKVTTIWSYERVETRMGGYVYDRIETVNALDIGHTQLIEYVYKTLDAIGIKDGPVHGEYMIDEKGPVLMEINCRPLGLAMPAKYIDLISGQHETDTFLDAMLDYESFERHLHDPYKMLRKGIIKLFISPKEVKVIAEPVRVLLEHMRSIHTIRLDEHEGSYYLEKTEDMEGNAGIVFMVHNNPYIVKMEANFLHDIESQYFRILYQSEPKTKPVINENCQSLKEVLKMLMCEGTTLVVSEGPEAENLDTVVVSMDELDDSMSGYDQVVIDFPVSTDGREGEIIVDKIFVAMEKVKIDGQLIVPESFYQKLPYGRHMIEALMKIGGFRIEIPSYDVHDVVCGRKIAK